MKKSKNSSRLMSLLTTIIMILGNFISPVAVVAGKTEVV